MLLQIISALSPLKLVIAGILFFNLAWVAPRKWLAIGVLGLSVGEAALSFLQAPSFASSAGEPVYTLIANALLAAAIWSAVRSLQRWARATVRRHEEEFWALVARDERQGHARAVDARPARFEPQQQHR